MGEIYDTGSEYVHLSNQHFYSFERIKDSEQIKGGIR